MYVFPPDNPAQPGQAGAGARVHELSPARQVFPHRLGGQREGSRHLQCQPPDPLVSWPFIIMKRYNISRCYQWSDPLVPLLGSVLLLI